MKKNGMSLSELLVVICVVGVFAMVSLPAFSSYQRQHALRAATAEIQMILNLTRQLSITRNRNVAVKFFQQSDQWHYAVYQDGDGDGVRNDDILKGVDRPLRPAVPVLKENRFAKIGLPGVPIKDPDSAQWIPASASPVRFNASKLCSFSPRGEGTSGSIFLTDGHKAAAMVRVLGATGRVRFLRYEPHTGHWK